MDKILPIALLAAAIVVGAALIVRKVRRGGNCCGEHEAAESRVKAADRNKSHYPHEVQMQIEGMTCENCARRVENALNALDGVWARVDIGTRRARVLLKEPPDEKALMRAVRDAGYAVSAFTDTAELKRSPAQTF